MTYFGVRLRNLRQQDNITQQELANALGMAKSSISMYENGHHEPDFETLEKIADFFNVPIGTLFPSGSASLSSQSTKFSGISEAGQRVGRLYDKADEKDQMLVESVLDKYEETPVTVLPSARKNPGGLIEFDVFDEPAAAGLGNYLDAPQSHKEQFPSFMVPKRANFGIRISGNSMEPHIADKSTVFVQSAPTVDSGKVGIFVLNGKSYCKQLLVDRKKKQVRLHSFNPDYEDILVTPYDDLRTIGVVL